MYYYPHQCFGVNRNLLEGNLVRLLLLLFMVMPSESSAALSWRQARKGGKMVMRNALPKLNDKHRTYLKRWLKLPLYGGVMVMLAFSPHAEEGNMVRLTNEVVAAAEMSRAPAEDEDEVSKQVQVASWSITLTTKGEIAHMHVRTIEEEEAIRIAGYSQPTDRGRQYLDEEPVLHYRADKNYVISGRPYNGFTFPLRVSWLAVERRRVLSNIHTVLRTVAASEKELVTLGNSMYRHFSQLDVATSSGYRFHNLAQQKEVKFAGKRFFDHLAVGEAIERRHAMLRTRRIDYKQRQHGVQLDQEVLNRADAAYHAALALLPSPSSEPTDLPLNLDIDAQEDADFVALVKSLAHLKLARLRLATEILSFYEPFEMLFFYSAGGVEEHLKLYSYADDSQYRGVALRYVSRTTSRRQRDFFTLGEIDFDHDLNIKKMWLSLKPRGGWSSNFAKLTFTPCTEGACPEPDFGD